jgi:hypothetical protein
MRIQVLGVTRRLAALILVAGLAFAGCGGGGTTTTVTTQSKAEYIARADRVCETAQAKRERLEGRVAEMTAISPGETHQVAQLLRRAADVLMVEVRRLRALTPPAGDSRTPGSLLSFLDDQITHLSGWANAYDRRNATEIRGFQARIADDTAKASAIAKHYGFQVCGSPGNGNTGNLTRFR